jgi:hypothetical protein
MDETKAQAFMLISVYEHLSKQYQLLMSLGNEVAALRETVAGLDPTFADVMEQKRKVFADRTHPTIAEDLAKYQLTIEQLKRVISS